MSLGALLLYQPSLSHFQGQIGKREKVMIRLQRLRNKEENRENYNLPEVSEKLGSAFLLLRYSRPSS